MTEALLITLKLGVSGMILALGMGSRFGEAVYLWQRPALLVRSLLAIYVVVPALALAGAALLPLPVGFKIGLLVLAVSGGAPLLPRKLMTLGNRDYVFSLVLTSSLVAVFVVPAWLAFLGPLFHREAVLTSWQVARVIAGSFLLPLVVGMTLRSIWPAWSGRWSDRFSTVFGVALLLSAVGLMALNAEILREVGWLPLATLIGFSLLALGVGHLMGGPHPADRTALAVTCATRHVGIVALLAASMPGPRTLVLLLLYVIAATLVSLPYLYWRQRPPRVAVSTPP
jgi:BASS family bile acid:Na+ symporter